MKQIYTKSYDSACISEQLPCLPNNPYFLKKKTDFVYSQILTERFTVFATNNCKLRNEQKFLVWVTIPSDAN